MSRTQRSRPTDPQPQHVPSDGAQRTRSFKRRVGAALSTLSLMSAIGAAVIGTFAAIRFGPFLAMGAAILGGNTEPTTPELGYPWLAVTLGVVGMAIGAFLSRQEAREKAGHALLHGGAIFVALLPLWHLYALWRTIRAAADSLP
ncbi:MAG: hypothetical protein H6742_17265 [Alphaproteobacteria bacterium]|nr:hypothetical protein [Alphaproteobacteria bacterium]